MIWRPLHLATCRPNRNLGFNHVISARRDFSPINTHRNIHWQAVLFIILICLSASAQRQTRQRRATDQQRAQQQAQEREQRRHDEEAVGEIPDAGADLAFVVAEQTNIYDEPDSSSKVLLRVKRGEVLALVERERAGPWYKVIHIDSAIEGWVNESDLIIKLTAKRENAPPLDREYVGDDRDPELSVTNQESATDLNLRINGTLYVVRAGTTRTFNLKPGRYDYYGWSPGVSPAIGRDDLRTGTRYSWTFKIVRRN